jgi:hypothetical protein
VEGSVNLRSPTRVTLPRVKGKDKVITLNLNNYRNNHYQINNNVKATYSEVMEPLVLKAFKGVKVVPPIELHYILYIGTKRKLDISNVLCIVDKCFQDVLVKCGVIEDDNYHYLTKVTYEFGEYSKGQDYADIYIKEVTTGEVHEEC